MGKALKAPLGFAGTSSLDYCSTRPGILEEEFWCVPSLRHGNRPSNDQFVILADDMNDAERLIREHIASDDIAGGLFTRWVGPASSEMIRSRNEYERQLMNLHKKWVDGGKVYSEEWKQICRDSRKKIRTEVRTLVSRWEPWFYDLLDSSRERIRTLNANLGLDSKRYPSGVTIRTGDEITDTINASFKSNARFNASAKLSAPLARSLQAISVVVAVTEIADSVARVYAAQSEKEEEQALRALFDTIGEQGGGTLGAYGGALLCGEVAISTFGTGLATCGVAIASGTAGGSKLGRITANGVYRLIGPATMDLLHQLKHGPSE